MGTVHPILNEYSGQIPKSLQTYKSIHAVENYEVIVEHTKQEMAAFRSLDGVLPDGRTVRDVLKESGCEESIEDMDGLDKDRIRVVGALNLILEFSEAMAED
ncbi:hypothetical protein NITGR_140028 [Nitrospina gracilis 3/211]|uniref:Uncharacterized protein n=1 Tax=Nitrospina gracilis (strain 3/211) TaxID=1266370 RepID=M1Z939_NITG3|nr:MULTISPECIES: hypothetical protein [Nitrospina]MCF8722689.1 hypothetical protein [Nitrospina sp. Nb-3]CCQ89631.1 hypothetical protein NITGR_140028 [Nitrospina gracilis 3/211]